MEKQEIVLKTVLEQNNLLREQNSYLKKKFGLAK